GLINGMRMVFDRKLGKVVLYGGDHAVQIPAGQPSADLWAYDGMGWTTLCTGCAPGPRVGHAMIYDTRRDRVVLIGGMATPAQVPGMWAWDGDWVKLPESGDVPGARVFAQMAYDESRDRYVLIGGAGNSGLTDYDANVFEYDPSTATWSLISVAGGPMQ